MRILYLRTSSMQCDPHVSSLYEFRATRPGYQDCICVFDYFVENQALQMLRVFQEFQPTHVVWLGVCGGPFQPLSSVFCKMRQTAKVIALVPEASNPDWEALISEYQEAFDLIVNLDGNYNWNDRGKGLTTLAIYGQRPYDSFWNYRDNFWSYRHNNWMSRPIDVGFCGGQGSQGSMRQQLIDYLRTLRRHNNIALLTEFSFIEVPGTYQLYADFMMSCKIIINSAGSADDRSKHVKGRVLEAGLAGCCLIEEEGSPIYQWIDPDCYFSWQSPQECERVILSLLSLYPEDAMKAATRLAEEVREKYSPQKLWGQIFDRLEK